MNKKHIIIYSHGFGVRKDDGGLFTDIAKGIPEAESVLFDYNDVNEKENTITVRPLSVQVKMLNEVIEKVRSKNPEAIIDIIAHSRGCQVVGIAGPSGIRKIILTAPPLNDDLELTIKRHKKNPQNVIDLSGMSRIFKSDRTILVPAKFWEERKNFTSIPFYNALSSQTELIFINANQDQIIGKPDASMLDKFNKKIKIIGLDGDHDFSGENRNFLIKEIRKIIL